MIHSKSTADERYRQIRCDIAELINSELSKDALTSSIRVSGYITADDVAQAQLWTSSHNFRIDWKRELVRFKKRPRRLELALHLNSSGKLLALALGRISDRKVVVSLHFIQKQPEPMLSDLGSIRLFPIILRYAEALGLSLGCIRVDIDSPMKGLITYYEGYGFDRSTRKGKKVTRLQKVIS